MGILLVILLLLTAIALVVTVFWGEIKAFYEQKTRVVGDAEGAALADELFGGRSVLGDSGPQVAEACRPIESALDAAEVEALDAFVKRIDGGLAGDDPAVWPDDDRSVRCLAEARAVMDEAEQVVERVAPRVEAGRVADELLLKAVDLLLEAEGHCTGDAGCRAALGRAIWIRSRGKQHRYRRMGIVHVLRLANDALEREPGHKEADVMRARAQVALGSLDAARMTLIDLMGRHPDDPDIIRTRSRWLLAHDDPRGAAAAIVDVLPAMTPELGHAERLRLGPLLLTAGRTREAAEVYDALLAWRDDLPEVHAGRARCFLEARDYGQAEQAAKRSLELEPSKEARDLLRQAMISQGKGA